MTLVDLLRDPGPPARLATVLVVGLAFATFSPALSAQSSPGTTASGGIHALGRLEPATGLITVGSRPGQRIDELKVAAGDQVAAGQVLAVLEGRKQAEAQLALAELQKKKSDFEKQSRRGDASFQKSQARDQLALERETFDRTNSLRLETATKVADLLRKTLDQATKLHDTLGGMIPDREKIEAEGRFVELQAKTHQAELDKQLLTFEKEQTLKKRTIEDARLAYENPDLGDDNPDFQMADAQIALAKSALADTQVVAPRAGKVLEVIAHAGEVGTGQLMLLGDVSAMVAVAEVFQSDVLRVKVGDPATVSILGQSFAGKVQAIGTVVGRNQAMNMDPRALKDVRVVKVRVTLDDPKTAARLVSMEAEVAITPSGGG